MDGSSTSFNRWRRARPPIRAIRLTPGWDRWVKTWCLDFVSTYNVVWNVPGDELDVCKTA